MPNLEKTRALQAKEKSIDFNRANLEQAGLVEAIAKSPGGGDFLRTLQEMSRAKSSKASQFSYFQNIFNIAREKNLPLASYPNLALYGEYLKEFTEIDLEKLIDEIGQAEDRAYVSSLPSRDARLIHSIDRYARLLETAYRIQMTSKDFKTLEVNEPDFSSVAFLAFLNRRLAAEGFFDEIVPLDGVLAESRKALARFYESVDRRDEAFLWNAGKLLAGKEEKAVVLISGGYHTQHLKSLFEREGYGYVVLSPIVTQETNQAKYEKLLLSPIRKEIRRLETTGEKSAGKSLSALEAEVSARKDRDGVKMLGAAARLAMGLGADLRAKFGADRDPLRAKAFDEISRRSVNAPFARPVEGARLSERVDPFAPETLISREPFPVQGIETAPRPSRPITIDEDTVRRWLEEGPSELRPAKEAAIRYLRSARVGYEEWRGRLREMAALVNEMTAGSDYAVILDRSFSKSRAWTYATAEPFLSHPAKFQIYHDTQLGSVEDVSAVAASSVKTFVLFDDCSYSGRQIAATFESVLGRALDGEDFRGTTFVIAVPFMSRRALDTILAVERPLRKLGIQVTVLPHETIPTLAESEPGVAEKDFHAADLWGQRAFRIFDHNTPRNEDRPTPDFMSMDRVLRPFLSSDDVPPYAVDGPYVDAEVRRWAEQRFRDLPIDELLKRKGWYAGKEAEGLEHVIAVRQGRAEALTPWLSMSGARLSAARIGTEVYAALEALRSRYAATLRRNAPSDAGRKLMVAEQLPGGFRYVDHGARYVVFSHPDFPDLVFKAPKNADLRLVYYEAAAELEMMKRLPPVAASEVSVSGVTLTAIPGVVPYAFFDGVIVQRALPVDPSLTDEAGARALASDLSRRGILWLDTAARRNYVQSEGGLLVLDTGDHDFRLTDEAKDGLVRDAVIPAALPVGYETSRNDAELAYLSPSFFGAAHEPIPSSLYRVYRPVAVYSAAIRRGATSSEAGDEMLSAMKFWAAQGVGPSGARLAGSDDSFHVLSKRLDYIREQLTKRRDELRESVAKRLGVGSGDSIRQIEQITRMIRFYESKNREFVANPESLIQYLKSFHKPLSFQAKWLQAISDATGIDPGGVVVVPRKDAGELMVFFGVIPGDDVDPNGFHVLLQEGEWSGRLMWVDGDRQNLVYLKTVAHEQAHDLQSERAVRRLSDPIFRAIVEGFQVVREKEILLQVYEKRADLREELEELVAEVVGGSKAAGIEEARSGPRAGEAREAWFARRLEFAVNETSGYDWERKFVKVLIGMLGPSGEDILREVCQTGETARLESALGPARFMSLERFFRAHMGIDQSIGVQKFHFDHVLLPALAIPAGEWTQEHGERLVNFPHFFEADILAPDGTPWIHVVIEHPEFLPALDALSFDYARGAITLEELEGRMQAIADSPTPESARAEAARPDAARLAVSPERQAAEADYLNEFSMIQEGRARIVVGEEGKTHSPVERIFGLPIVEKTVRERNLTTEPAKLEFVRGKLNGVAARTVIHDGKIYQEYAEPLLSLKSPQQSLLWKIPADRGKALIDAFMALQKERWRRGVFDIDSNIYNHGITLDGRLVTFDFEFSEPAHPGRLELGAMFRANMSAAKNMPPALREYYEDEMKDLNYFMEQGRWPEKRLGDLGPLSWDTAAEDLGVLGLPPLFVEEAKNPGPFFDLVQPARRQILREADTLKAEPGKSAGASVLEDAERPLDLKSGNRPDMDTMAARLASAQRALPPLAGFQEAGAEIEGAVEGARFASWRVRVFALVGLAGLGALLIALILGRGPGEAPLPPDEGPGIREVELATAPMAPLSEEEKQKLEEEISRASVKVRRGKEVFVTNIPRLVRADLRRGAKAFADVSKARRDQNINFPINLDWPDLCAGIAKALAEDPFLQKQLVHWISEVRGPDQDLREFMVLADKLPPAVIGAIASRMKAAGSRADREWWLEILLLYPDNSNAVAGDVHAALREVTLEILESLQAKLGFMNARQMGEIRARIGNLRRMRLEGSNANAAFQINTRRIGLAELKHVLAHEIGHNFLNQAGYSSRTDAGLHEFFAELCAASEFGYWSTISGQAAHDWATHQHIAIREALRGESISKIDYPKAAKSAFRDIVAGRSRLDVVEAILRDQGYRGRVVPREEEGKAKVLIFGAPEGARLARGFLKEFRQASQEAGEFIFDLDDTLRYGIVSETTPEGIPDAIVSLLCRFALQGIRITVITDNNLYGAEGGAYDALTGPLLRKAGDRAEEVFSRLTLIAFDEGQRVRLTFPEGPAEPVAQELGDVDKGEAALAHFAVSGRAVKPRTVIVVADKFSSSRDRRGDYPFIERLGEDPRVYFANVGAASTDTEINFPLGEEGPDRTQKLLELVASVRGAGAKLATGESPEPAEEKSVTSTPEAYFKDNRIETVVLSVDPGLLSYPVIEVAPVIRLLREGRRNFPQLKRVVLDVPADQPNTLLDSFDFTSVLPGVETVRADVDAQRDKEGRLESLDGQPLDRSALTIVSWQGYRGHQTLSLNSRYGFELAQDGRRLNFPSSLYDLGFVEQQEKRLDYMGLRLSAGPAIDESVLSAEVREKARAILESVRRSLGLQTGAPVTAPLVIVNWQHGSYGHYRGIGRWKEGSVVKAVVELLLRTDAVFLFPPGNTKKYAAGVDEVLREIGAELPAERAGQLARRLVRLDEGAAGDIAGLNAAMSVSSAYFGSLSGIAHLAVNGWGRPAVVIDDGFDTGSRYLPTATPKLEVYRDLSGVDPVQALSRVLAGARLAESVETDDPAQFRAMFEPLVPTSAEHRDEVLDHYSRIPGTIARYNADMRRTIDTARRLGIGFAVTEFDKRDLLNVEAKLGLIDIRRTIMEAADRMGATAENPLRVLDVGAGKGVFLSDLYDQLPAAYRPRVYLAGIDPIPVERSFSDALSVRGIVWKQGFFDYASKDDFGGRGFHVIYGTEVLQYAYNPKLFLDHVRDLLEEGGEAVIGNANSLGQRIRPYPAEEGRVVVGRGRPLIVHDLKGARLAVSRPAGRPDGAERFSRVFGARLAASSVETAGQVSSDEESLVLLAMSYLKKEELASGKPLGFYLEKIRRNAVVKFLKAGSSVYVEVYSRSGFAKGQAKGRVLLDETVMAAAKARIAELNRTGFMAAPRAEVLPSDISRVSLDDVLVADMTRLIRQAAKTAQAIRAGTGTAANVYHADRPIDLRLRVPENFDPSHEAVYQGWVRSIEGIVGGRVTLQIKRAGEDFAVIEDAFIIDSGVLSQALLDEARGHGLSAVSDGKLEEAASSFIARTIFAVLVQRLDAPTEPLKRLWENLRSDVMLGLDDRVEGQPGTVFDNLKTVGPGAAFQIYRRLTVKSIRAAWNQAIRAAEKALAAVGSAA